MKYETLIAVMPLFIVGSFLACGIFVSWLFIRFLQRSREITTIRTRTNVTIKKPK